MTGQKNSFKITWRAPDVSEQAHRRSKNLWLVFVRTDRQTTDRLFYENLDGIRSSKRMEIEKPDKIRAGFCGDPNKNETRTGLLSADVCKALYDSFERFDFKFRIQNFEWNFIILNFTIHHGNPNYTIFCLISVQSYVYTRFFNGWTWCNLSCPWFEWIFEMSMNKTQLPINGIIKFRKIFAKILKDSENFWKLGKLNFSFFRIWKMRLSLARMMSVWNISIKRTSGILLTYGHFRIRTFFISKSKFRNVFFCNKWPTWIYTSVRYKLFAQKFFFLVFEHFERES